MTNIRKRANIGLPEGLSANALLCASLALCLSFAAASPALSDVVKLKNGDLIKCKVVKEMQDLIKVRMPHRGKIVTTFLNRGSVKSISKAPDMENRKLFQRGGVHNPGRNYEPVYYSGSAAGYSGAGRAPAKGKARVKTAARKRGVEARRARSEARAKSRSDRFGRRSSRGTKVSTGVTSGSSPSQPTSPSTSSSSKSSAD
jgi:hypothetical protein